MTPVIAADQLTKYYGHRLAVDDVSFEVDEGEVLGLLGPNGSGKSTILRMLTGYLHPSTGGARIAGFDVAEHGLEARRRIGYVAEDTALYPHMRVHEFLTFMGRLKGMSRNKVGGAVDGVCAQFSLGHVRRLAIGKLSRGYRQRVAIAQALLNDPALLILDEPTNGLDPRQIMEVRELIRSLAARHTILVTSHILGEIEKMATRVAILLDGRLVALESLGQDARPKIRLRVRSASPERVTSVLLAAAGVTNLVSVASCAHEVHDFIVQIEGLTVAERLAAELTGAGFGLLAMNETRTDLEALFLGLTGQTAP